jgi:hypothetical protein
VIQMHKKKIFLSLIKIIIKKYRDRIINSSNLKSEIRTLSEFKSKIKMNNKKYRVKIINLTYLILDVRPD